MAVVVVLVFVAAHILIATERVPKSRALLLADLSGRGFCSGSKTREGGPMDGKCKPEAAHSSHLWRCAHARHGGRLGRIPQPADPADLDLIHEILYATIIYDLAAEPDTHNARDIAERLTAVLRQTGYRSEGMVQT